MRKLKRGSMLALLPLILVTFALTGCAAIQKSNAMSTERLLSASGFHMKFAQSAEQTANLQGMAQRKLTTHIKDGELNYVYADAKFCNCVYVGTEENYQAYQKLSVQQDIADEQQMTASMNEEAAMSWGAWGAFPRRI